MVINSSADLNENKWFINPLMDNFINIIVHHQWSKGYLKHVSSLVGQILLYIKHPATEQCLLMGIHTNKLL